MSGPLESFRDAVRKRIEDRANLALNRLGAVRFREASPAQASNTVVAIPSFSMEEIALAHTLHQAEAQVLTEIIAYVDEEFRKAMGQPSEPNNPEKTARIAKQETEKQRGVY